MKKLEGKVAAITGAASGIGKAIATLFAENGAKIFICDINDTALQEFLSELKKQGFEAQGIKTDVSKKEEVELFIEKTAEIYGTIDILVNNAGIMDYNAGAATVTDEVFERVLKVNFYSVLYSTRKALAFMLQKKSGVIINIASVGGFSGGVAGVAYTASKHAVVGFTKNTAWIYGPEGIRCNAICPGAVETNIMASIDQSKLDPQGSARLQMSYSLIPKVLKPEDIAKTALFLASDDAQAINGQIITVDAGWTAAF